MERALLRGLNLEGISSEPYQSIYWPLCVIDDGQLIEAVSSNADMSAFCGSIQTVLFCLVLNNTGACIWDNDGLRYSFNSHEGNRHNVPHVHVDYKHEGNASIAISNGEVLTSSGNIKSKKIRLHRRKLPPIEPICLSAGTNSQTEFE